MGYKSFNNCRKSKDKTYQDSPVLGSTLNQFVKLGDLPFLWAVFLDLNLTDACGIGRNARDRVCERDNIVDDAF